MSILKKLLVLKNDLGLVVIGLLFTVIGGVVVVSGNSDGSLMPLGFAALGVLVLAAGIWKTARDWKTPAAGYGQYDRVDLQAAPASDLGRAEDTAAEGFVRAEGFEEQEEDFVFHFTGKGNQSYVMEDENGARVYEAVTDKILMLKERPYVFRNCRNGQEVTRMVGAPVSTSVGGGGHFGGVTISSTFRIDGQDVWDQIASAGYGFTFSLHGMAAHYDVRYRNQPVGFAELGGTGLVNPKYKNNPMGKVPTNGIFKVHCRRSDVPGFFLICFALTLTECTVN